MALVITTGGLKFNLQGEYFFLESLWQKCVIVTFTAHRSCAGIIGNNVIRTVFNHNFLNERNTVRYQKVWQIFPILSGFVLSGSTEREHPLTCDKSSGQLPAVFTRGLNWTVFRVWT